MSVQRTGMVVALAASTAWSQEAVTPKSYLSFQVGYVGNASSTANQNQGFESETRLLLADQFSGRIEMRPERASGEVTWFPRNDAVTMEGNLSESRTVRSNLTGEGGVRATETRVDSYGGDATFAANVVNAFVKLRPAEKRYDIQFTLMADMATTLEAVRMVNTRDIVGAPSLRGGLHERSSQVVPLSFGATEMRLNSSYDYLPVVVTGESYGSATGDLAGAKDIPIPKPAGWNGPWQIALRVSWQLDVTPLPLELIVAAEGYEAWRPETTPERAAGEPLEVTAKVVSTTGGPPGAKVERFIWELVNTSREPGVALNFPLDQFTDDPDLELDASGAGFVLSQEKQRMVRTGHGGLSDSAKVVPFDWGGWSTLQVTAVLDDGRRLRGKLKGKTEFGMRVPKRDRDSHIADAWKAKHKSGADNLDDENEPVGDGNKGDGFALYEEYRGFVIEGRHVEGDPKAKDFFVLNHIGADAEAGIALFESLSGFRVHTSTLDTEISPDHRVMNANRTDGAQVVLQHAVKIETFDSVEKLGGGGAYTVSLSGQKDGKNSFRPGMVKGIGILPRGHGDSDFTKPFNLSPADQLAAFDRAIAHELMHSVGAIHHGTGDANIEFSFIPPQSRSNTVGRPYFAVGEGTSPVELRDEAKHDIAAAVYVRYAAALSAYAAMMRAPLMGNPEDAGYPRMTQRDFEALCSANVNRGFELKGLLGVEGGAHAGEQDCIMRYYFANFYPMKQSADGFYHIAPGAERIGSILCGAQAGTGVNAPGHYPQSRHGNSPGGAGNCAAQISPNDLFPPRATPF